MHAYEVRRLESDNARLTKQVASLNTSLKTSRNRISWLEDQMKLTVLAENVRRFVYNISEGAVIFQYPKKMDSAEIEEIKELIKMSLKEGRG